MSADKNIINNNQTIKKEILATDSAPDVQSMLKVAVEQMHEGIQIVSRSWHYIYLNEAAATHARAKKEDLLGRTMQECNPGFEGTEAFELLRKVMDDRVARSMDNEFEYADRGKCWFELNVEPHPMGILIRSMDITKRKRLEEAYLHSQKLEAIGRLVGGIAHDFNNKLGVMFVFAEMAQDALPPGPSALRDYLDNILLSVEQASNLTRQLLAFGRKQVLDMRVVNLNPWLKGMEKTLAKVVGEDIKTEFYLDENLANVRVDLSQMDQILLNLCINSRDAMENGGRLIIETSNVDVDESYAQTHQGVVPGEYVMISVSDTGVGMTPEVRSRIFEPFFTTKGLGSGTGLGLSSVHGIVNQSRGHIWVYSEPGRGTTFKLYFPVASGDIEERRNVTSVRPKIEGSEKILLVEDDPLLQAAYAHSLQQAGYSVISAENSSEAESLFESNKGAFQLLISDVILPGMNGAELARILKTRKPDLSVIFVSGYTENSIVHHAILDEESVLIQKPVSIRKLLQAVREVLDGKLKKGII